MRLFGWTHKKDGQKMSLGGREELGRVGAEQRGMEDIGGGLNPIKGFL